LASLHFVLNDSFQPLIDFSQFRILFFNMEIQNFEGPALEFAFGNPAEGAEVAIRVPNKSTTTRENRALAGALYGRTTQGTAQVTVEIW
jgi:hypothetical protein